MQEKNLFDGGTTRKFSAFEHPVRDFHDPHLGREVIPRVRALEAAQRERAAA
ncbi:hypothetical protein [Methylobacterium oryzihabitans]|uniref:hypothetical protein n=1 Tax=Methylobacterium oryzihabitans TaxID=2499852 RepID=UPI001651E62F|nr:hypothetical protein [Methylobacterium oryzihabitans]